MARTSSATSGTRVSHGGTIHQGCCDHQGGGGNLHPDDHHCHCRPTAIGTGTVTALPGHLPVPAPDCPPLGTAAADKSSGASCFNACCGVAAAGGGVCSKTQRRLLNKRPGAPLDADFEESDREEESGAGRAVGAVQRGCGGCPLGREFEGMSLDGYVVCVVLCCVVWCVWCRGGKDRILIGWNFVVCDVCWVCRAAVVTFLFCLGSLCFYWCPVSFVVLRI